MNDYASMTNADFKARIRRLMGDKATVQGASHADPCVVRKPGDRGFDKIGRCANVKRDEKE